MFIGHDCGRAGVGNEVVHKMAASLERNPYRGSTEKSTGIHTECVKKTCMEELLSGDTFLCVVGEYLTLLQKQESKRFGWNW